MNTPTIMSGSAHDPVGEMRMLRDAFGCFTTGVTVVTTLAEDGTPVGFTANSFASVSLDPPLAVMSVAHTSSSLPHLLARGQFAINILHSDQQALARQFTLKGVDRFAGADTWLWDTGVPVIAGCMASFECITEQSFDSGDHRVFIGRVLKFGFEPDHEPLVYLRGAYRRVHVED